MYFHNFFILICNILILKTHTQSQKGPGISSCSFDGNFGKACGVQDVSVTDTPNECTAIIYDGAFVDLRYHVFGDSCSCEEDESILARLDGILKSGKRTFLYYGHATVQEWSVILSCEACIEGAKSSDEMKGLKAFLDEHKGITGVILFGLEYNEYTTKPFTGYSDNLKKYIEVMKTSLPDLEIGLQFQGQYIINQTILHNSLTPWLDINIIAPVTDFFVLSTSLLNDCTKDLDLYRTGVAPMTSKSTPYTLENLKCAMQELSFPKEKTIFKFRVSPTSDPNDSNTGCDLTMQQLCLNPTKACDWCSDNQTTFNEKGKFAKKFGAGFMTNYIDLNDALNECKCNKPFTSFYSLLDGYNGCVSQPCHLFNRM